METGEVDRLCISGKVRQTRLVRVWESILVDFVNEFDIADSYRRYLELMKKACILYKKAYCDGDKINWTLAKVKEAEAEEIMQSIPEPDFNKLLAQVSKFMGYRINPNEVTVKEFYGYLKLTND